MARVHRHGEPALDKTGYFRMTQGEHEAMRSAAKVRRHVVSLHMYANASVLMSRKPGLVISTVARPPVPAALPLQKPVGSVRSSTALFGRPRGNT